MTIIQVSDEAKAWIKSFAKIYGIENDSRAVDKLIEIHKAWNDRIEVK